MASIISAGTSTNTAVSITGDTTGALALATNNGTTAVTIDTSQVVTLSNTILLANNNYIGFKNTSGSVTSSIFNDTSNDLWLYNGSATNTRFYTNATERMRINSTGNVGIGTASPSSNARLTVSGTTGSGTGGGILITGSGYQTSPTGMVLGQYDATTFYIQRPASSTFEIWDSASNSSLRVDASGNLLVNLTTPPMGATVGSIANSVSAANNTFWSRNSNATPYGFELQYSSAAPNGTGNAFFEMFDTSATRAVFRSNGGLANYSANNANLSDRREKTNFAPAKPYLETICAIPVQTFNYIDQNLEEDDGLTLGVVAQDVQEVAPELVHESNWAGKGEPEKLRLSIYQTDLQYALMKSIQELKTIVDAQAVEIAALKAKVGS